MPRCHKNHNPMLPVRPLKQGYRSSTLDEIASMGNTRTVTEPDFQNHKPRIKKINCAKKKKELCTLLSVYFIQVLLIQRKPTFCIMNGVIKSSFPLIPKMAYLSQTSKNVSAFSC